MRLSLLALGLTGCLSLTTLNTHANLEVTAGFSISATADFEAPLASHGSWVTVGSYGRCWRPTGIASGWRPYCDGEWVWTDCGWYWQSDEPFAWACYHYGNWYLDSSYGWVWIPGVEWGPSWVSWRSGGGYIGWAPLGPSGVTVAVGGPQFVFVQNTRFRERLRPTTVIVNNTTIINKTTVINNVRRENRNVGGSSRQVVVNEGPGIAPFQQAKQKVEPVKITEAATRTQVPAEVRQRGGNNQQRRDNNNPAAPNQNRQGQPNIQNAPNQRQANPETPTPNERRQPQPGKVAPENQPQPTPAQPDQPGRGQPRRDQRTQPDAARPNQEQPIPAQPAQPNREQPRQKTKPDSVRPDQEQREEPRRARPNTERPNREQPSPAQPDQPRRPQPKFDEPKPEQPAQTQPRQREEARPTPTVPPGQQRKSGDSVAPERRPDQPPQPAPNGPPPERPRKERNDDDNEGRGKGKP